MRRNLLALVLLLLPLNLAAQTLEEEKIAPLVKMRPIVVELYTSQGCTSCPPADAFAGELANRADVLPLSFHVDYWDYIGWKDPFAIPEASKRQKKYNTVLGIGSYFTPQMVIDGVTPTVGSHKNAVNKSIEKLKFNAPSIPMTVSVDKERGELVLKVAGVEDGVQVETLPDYLDVWMVTYNRGYTTPVDAGENVGKEIPTYNVVRRLSLLGKWNQRSNFYRIKLEGFREDAVAFILQQEEQGRIMGVVTFANR